MLAASSDSRRRHGATLHDDAGREKSVGDGWHVTARLFRQLLTNRIERPRTLGEMKRSEKVNSSKWRAQSAFDWIGSRDGRSITWHHERLGFSTAIIQSPTFFSLPYVISIDFSPSLAFSDCLGRTGRKSAQCDVWSFFLNSARLSTFVHLSHSMHIIIPARNERWRSWACAVCVCVYFALHCRVLRDRVTVSQLATTPLNINKPCFVYFVHWKGENIFASFFSHFISIFVDCSNMISAYQRQSCSLVAAMETGQQRERAWNQHTQSSMPPFSFASNCTGANQTGDSSDFIFPSPALVQLFRLIASSLLYFFKKFC
jgi:hypothetical protein